MKLKIILIFLLIIILIILLLKKNTFEYLEYSYNDYEKTLKTNVIMYQRNFNPFV